MDLLPPPGASRSDVIEIQRQRLSLLLCQILPQNRFYGRKFAEAGLDAAALKSVDDLRRLPFTTKAELFADQAEYPPFGSVHTYAVDKYTRYHQTSGTSGQPLRWLDTPESWSNLLDLWLALLRIAGVAPTDRLFFPFSFGPFLGFWTAFEAGARFGCLCLPGGGMSSTARLRFMADNRPTVVFCTPTYALHLAEVARSEGMDLPAAGVRAVVVAGEPGGSIAFTRARIEAGWGARVIDHNGMTETGPLGIECQEAPGGLHLLETACVAEVIDGNGQAVAAGTPGELVITSLSRPGSPLLRYRTGDLVCIDPRPCPCGRPLLRLDAGIHGRVDDMIIIRGNNVHPATLQRILHRFPEVAEYRVEVEVDTTSALPVLRVHVEPRADFAAVGQLAARVDRAIHDELLFRAEVGVVAPGTLPRFEMKSQRVVWKTPPDSRGGTPSDARNS
jgi:phenylacetate-CoA ligase